MVQRVAKARRAAAGGARAEDYVAVGNAKAVLDRIERYRVAGVSKFVLIPIASGDRDLMDQTERLVAEVLPLAHSAS